MKSVFPSEHSSNDYGNYETSTSVARQESQEQVTRSSREFDDFTTSEMNTASSAYALMDREHQEEPFETTLETSTEFHDHALRGVQSDDEDHEQYTTVTDEMIKREFQEEPITSTYMVNHSSLPRGREFITVIFSQPSFSSTSSAVAPHLYTEEPMTSSQRSTTRRADRVEGRVDEQHEDEEKPVKHMTMKTKKAPMKKNQVERHEDKSHEDKSHEDKSHEEDSQVRSAVYEGSVMRNMSTLPTNEMQVEKNDQLIEIPKDLLRPMKTQVKSSKQPLSQGSTLVLFLVAALLFCACLMASTLAFVSSFQNGKRLRRDHRQMPFELLRSNHDCHDLTYSFPSSAS